MKEAALPNHLCLKTYRPRECPQKKPKAGADLGSPVGVTAADGTWRGPAEVTALQHPDCESL